MSKVKQYEKRIKELEAQNFKNVGKPKERLFTYYKNEHYLQNDRLQTPTR